MKNYYHILGIKETATLAEVKAEYRKLSKKYHPDANGGNKSFEGLFREVQEAYEVLSDDARRTAYNQDLKYYRFEQNTQRDKEKAVYEAGEKKQTDFYKYTENAKFNEEVPVTPKTLKTVLTNKYILFPLLGLLAAASIGFLMPMQSVENRPAATDTKAVPATADVDARPVAGIAKLEEQKNYWRRFSGSWVGSGTELNLKKNFTIKLTCDFEKNSFLIEYPTHGFSGSWELMETEEREVIFKETIETGLMHYAKAGSVKLSVLGEDKLAYSYYFPNGENLLATGILTRH